MRSLLTIIVASAAGGLGGAALFVTALVLAGETTWTEVVRALFGTANDAAPHLQQSWQWLCDAAWGIAERTDPAKAALALVPFAAAIAVGVVHGWRRANRESKKGLT